MDNRLDPISTIVYYYRVKAKSARKCYKQKKDGYKDWNQAAHCGEYLVFPENLTPHLAIDEVNFTQGELYTFVSSRDRTGRAQKLIAMIRGTRSEDIIKVLNRIPLSKRMEESNVFIDKRWWKGYLHISINSIRILDLVTKKAHRRPLKASEWKILTK